MPLIERIQAALFAALQGVPGVQLCERNRTTSIPDGTTPALVLSDGDIEGRTDRPGAYAANRLVTFPLAVEPVVWGYVEGSDRTIGSKRNELFAATVQAIFTNMPLRQLLAANGGGLTIEDAAFPMPGADADTAAAIFVLRLGLSFTFDPANP